MTSATLIIIIITIGISALAFRDQEWMNKLLLNPYRTYHKKEIWRILTHGFVHANWWHLGINMFVLYSFGLFCERYMEQLAQNHWIKIPMMNYLILYFGGIIAASIPSVIKNKDNPWYNSVGASGGVSSVVFASIFFQPLQLIYFYFIPIPGILFGILFLAYSQYMSRKERGNINHDAHFTGAVFGFLYPLLIQPQLFPVFLHQLNIF
ncbi:MAG: rhomboid family intramembrane serine protease [Chlorobi bacterium]|nr:rhomboid family intramembrane serine protease [Chlorobiota bacterium]